jgi:O-antigen ligase
VAQPDGPALAVAVALVCGLGTVFTLTRAVWLGGVLAVLATAAVTPVLRRWIVPGAAAGVLLVIVLVTLVPGLSDSVGERAGSQRPLWDRYNSNVAALNIVQAEPLTGVGWQRFPRSAGSGQSRRLTTR